MTKAILISLRDPDDPMAEHERACFAESSRLDVEEVQLHFLTRGVPDLMWVEEVGTIFFGGSGAYSVLDEHPWIRDSVELMLAVIDRKIPAYASCFGFQGLAKALGGTVLHDESLTEIGSYALTLTEAGQRDALFGSLPAKFWAQEGHHDHVMSLPQGVTLLATGAGVPKQAFKVDGAPFWASQFHPELSPQRTLERFHHYAALYVGDDPNREAVQARLEDGRNSPEVPDLLARLVRGRF